MDEAGRGPWAGPVVAAAVILTTRRPLAVRIDDSKRLSGRQRLAAFPVILRHAHVGIGVVPADAVDTVNIRQATLQAMRQAVERLGIAPDVVLVDGNDPPPLPVPCWPIVGGDQVSYPIACASIIAKVSRDALMVFAHRLFPEYGFDRHKGYGTAEHLALLRAHGPSPIHRMTFEPVQLLRNAFPD